MALFKDVVSCLTSPVLLYAWQNLQSELCSKIFWDLLEYVSNFRSRLMAGSDVNKPYIPVSEIPAAALVMGEL